MPRGRSQIKKKSSLNKDSLQDIQNIFNPLLGIDSEEGLDINIVLDKYSRLINNINRLIKLFENFIKNLLSQFVEHEIISFEVYIKDINDFAIRLSDILKNHGINTLTHQELLKNYLVLKKEPILDELIHTCSKMSNYKKFIKDKNNLNEDFLKDDGTTLPIHLFSFSDLDFKFVFNHHLIDDKLKKYIIIFLNMAYNTVLDIYDINTSPDINIEEMSEKIIEFITKAQKDIPRCDLAFNAIKNSIDLLKMNFNGYYKDFVQNGSPVIIIENFLLDVTKTHNSTDTKLKQQCMKIISFYQKKISSKKIKNPMISKMFEKINNNINLMDNVTQNE
jgi:hypothetical protein